MREIKFRGKGVKTNKWYIGDLTIEYNGTTHINLWKSVLLEPENNYYEPIHIMDEVEPKTVGQYTGLKDKNGVDVYEGDIVTMSEGFFKNRPMEVKWCEINLCHIITFKGLSKSKEMKITKLKKLLVIGNVHQNSELLNQ